MQEEKEITGAVDQVESTPTEQQSAQQAVDLNINDLVALRSIIDVASTRGAFRANEMEAVGKVFNKLATFLDTVAAKEQPKE
jgi:hypothetical protein